jgi:CheY-like chemotaxis protein
MSRILLIDDDPGVRDSMERTLRGAGYAVQSVPTGEEGFEMGKGGVFDVILSDMRMPGISGLDILSQLRDLRVGSAFISRSADSPIAGVPTADSLTSGL